MKLVKPVWGKGNYGNRKGGPSHGNMRKEKSENQTLAEHPLKAVGGMNLC